MSSHLPSPAPRERSSYKPVFLTLFFSFLLAGGTCFGFLNTPFINGTSPMNTVCAAGFAFCALTFLGALVWLVIKVLIDAVREIRGGE
jgi:hypothetical protein